MMARILLIDDNTAVRVLFRRILERAGYDVLEAPDGAVGLRVYRANPTDLVITDIFMPEKEGLETIMELRREFPLARVIAISGGGGAMSGMASLQLAKRLGADRTLAKPVKGEELLSAVRAVLSGA